MKKQSGEIIDVKNALSKTAAKNGLDAKVLQLPDCELDPAKIRVVMISEVPPKNPKDGFYSADAGADYMKTARGLFEAGGAPIQTIGDILAKDIYVTTAVKSPKDGYTVDPETLAAHLPLLEAELALFPNLRVVMLMGDVAKKAFNTVAKTGTRRNVIPSGATGGLRHREFFWNNIRVFPSYIMTGKNLLIEPFKRDCVTEDIRRMFEFLNNGA